MRRGKLRNCGRELQKEIAGRLRNEVQPTVRDYRTGSQKGIAKRDANHRSGTVEEGCEPSGGAGGDKAETRTEIWIEIWMEIWMEMRTRMQADARAETWVEVRTDVQAEVRM